jgi:hypothetical protein
VIVVAQKREENLQETAIAITALSGTTMDDLNISNSTAALSWTHCNSCQ